MRPVLPSALLVVGLILTVGGSVCVVEGTIGWDNCTDQFAVGFWPDLPSSNSDDTTKLCRAGAIAIAYDDKMIDPGWSAYKITPDDVHTLLPGRSSFYEDPDLKELGVTQAAVKSDAFNQSWNRGHLCPSHIMSRSREDKKATYTMANVAPQYGPFNQQGWQRMEAGIVTYINDTGRTLHIVTGVAYDDRAHARRTYDNIAVPDYYFNVLCDVEAGQSVGWYGDNRSPNKGISWKHTALEMEEIYGGRLLPYECNPGELDENYWLSLKPDVSRAESLRNRDIQRRYHEEFHARRAAAGNNDKKITRKEEEEEKGDEPLQQQGSKNVGVNKDDEPKPRKSIGKKLKEKFHKLKSKFVKWFKG